MGRQAFGHTEDRRDQMIGVARLGHERAGAAAFVPKSGDIDQIIEAILRVTGRNSGSEE